MEGYIVDKYNKYCRFNEDVIEVFNLYISDKREPYCIRKVVFHYDWGDRVPEPWDAQLFDETYEGQYVFETLEEAKKFIRELRGY